MNLHSSLFFRRVEHCVDLNMNAAEGLDGGMRGTMEGKRGKEQVELGVEMGV